MFKRGDAPHINNIELGRLGRNRTNVWDYPGQNVLSGTSKSKLSLHPTVKPVALVADAIWDCSNRNGVILDPFGGAGTTLIAAKLALHPTKPKTADFEPIRLGDELPKPLTSGCTS